MAEPIAGPDGPSQELSGWDLLGLPGQLAPANFLTVPSANQYRLIVDTLAEQQSVSLTGVGHEELTALLRARLPETTAGALLAELNLAARLGQLVSWGTLESWQDTAETEADFLRNRSRYQLTEAGSFLHRVARQVETEIGAGSTAALMAPGSLADRLDATLIAVRADDFAAASTEYAQVETTLSTMSASAAAWQSKLAAALGGPPEEARIIRLLETILAYVEAWGSGVDAYTTRISAAVPALEAYASDVWRRLALARLGSGAPDQAVEAAAQDLLQVVGTIRHWFCGAVPQAQRLRRQMRDAVAPVLRSHRTLLAVGGTVSRKADLIRLAHAIEAAPDADSAWSVWTAATSLFPARHLRVPSAIEPGQPLHTSVWDSPPAAISSRLRAQGQHALVGRTAKMADTSAAKAAARELASRDRADLARAEADLAQRSGTRLSAWAPLDAAATDLFLTLLSAARDHRDPDDGSMTGLSSDGRWRLRLWPVDPRGSAVIRTPTGRLVVPDARVEITA